MPSKKYQPTDRQADALLQTLAQRYPEIPVETPKSIDYTVEQGVISASITFFFDRRSASALFRLKKRNAPSSGEYWYCERDWKD